MKGRRAARRFARLARAGYTMVEVMMAIAVLAIGLLAIAALQTTTVSGNIQAQETTVATSLARLWVERLRRDAVGWTLGATPPAGASCGSPATNNICVATRYLRRVQAMDATGTPPWEVPATGAALPGGDPYVTGFGSQSPAFDFHGRDVNPLGPDWRYCTNVRIGWVYYGSTLRADVRVFWHKRFRGDGTPMRIGCTTPQAALLNVASVNGAGRADLFRAVSAVYVSTLIRYTPQRY